MTSLPHFTGNVFCELIVSPDNTSFGIQDEAFIPSHGLPTPKPEPDICCVSSTTQSKQIHSNLRTLTSYPPNPNSNASRDMGTCPKNDPVTLPNKATEFSCSYCYLADYFLSQLSPPTEAHIPSNLWVL